MNKTTEEKVREALEEYKRAPISIMDRNGTVYPIDTALSAIDALYKEKYQPIQPYWYKDEVGTYHHIGFANNTIYIDGKDVVKAKYLALLPEERTVQEMLNCLSTKDESVDTLLEKHTKIATITGFNSAIQEFKKRVIEFRVDAKSLDIVCIDCGDFLKHACVECEDCPVNRLKGRLRFQNEYKIGKPNSRRVK